jgi:hypothetical protein
LKRKIDRLATDEKLSIMEDAARDAMVVLDREARNTYPPSPRPRPQAQNWTAKQRAWWWATMHAKASGRAPYALPGWKAEYRTINNRKILQISGSYKRTGRLVQSLRWRVLRRNNRIVGEYGTNTQYAPLVIGNNREQALYHRGNWKQLVDVVEDSVDMIEQAYKEAIEKELERRLGNA